MGPSRKLNHDEVKALLRDKDEQIAVLERQLEAYNARTSTAHVRLLKTIDVLDSLRTQHALEMSSLVRERMRFTQDVNRWRTVARTLEIERDEMKDAVEDLIEKIQISNEWNSWPCSRMYITKHAELIPLPSDEPNHEAKRHENDLLEYASSIIAKLRAELDFERREHGRTAEEANVRIDELEAKVAVREAELETCINAPPRRIDHDDTRCSPSRDIPKKAHLRPRTISDEECLRVLESSSARNKSLEMEIHDILVKLEKARLANPLSEAAILHPVKLPAADPPLSNSNSDDPKFGMNVEMQGTRVSTRVLPIGTASTLPSKNDEDPPQRSIELHSPSSPSAMFAIAQLDNHIRTMSAQTDALKAERSMLVAAAAKQKREVSGTTADRVEDVLRIEEECIQLSAQVHYLQQEVHRTQTSAKAREEELLREIETLRLQLRQLSPPYHPGLFDVSNADESMELATPLEPTTIFPPPDPQTPPEPVDPSLIPLPFSPKRTSSPPASSPGSLHSPAQRDLQRVQDALMTARDNLMRKECVLAQLRTDVENLQRQIPLSGSSTDQG